VFFKKNGIKLHYSLFRNLQESIPRRIAAVMKAKIGPAEN
jgi:hypothetical protein